MTVANTTIVAIGDLRAEALGRIRDYVDAEGGNKRANRLLRENQATIRKTQEAHAHFRNMVELSDSYDDILEAALAAIDAQRYAQAYEQIGIEMRAYIANAGNNKPVYRPDATAPALSFLNDELHALMATVRAQESALAGIHDARSAMRGGGASQDAWAVLEDQLDRYAVLREIQRHIVVILDDEGGRRYRIEVLNRSGHLKNSFDHERHWEGARRFATARDLERGEASFRDWVRNPPHPPFDRTGNDIFPDDAIAYLRWISDGDKAWIPDTDEMIRVDELAAKILAPHPLKQRKAAVDAYFDARDLTPLTPSPSTGSFE
ncbi:hypothetical protein [Microbacterium sp.]|uniref:hypothetical protein n=1 Tax=Microbacterium sp. TaxID=51671 RepID=UPI0039E44FCD